MNRAPKLNSVSPSLHWVKPTVYSLLAIIVCLSLGIALSRYDSRPLSLDHLRTEYALPKSEFMALAGQDIHVVDEGSGPVLILLHGNANSLWIWNEWAAEFIAQGYRVIRFDLPTYGLSAPISTQELGIIVTYEVLSDLLEKKEISRAVLIGTANGGPPAAWYAANHPDRVSGLVLVNTPFYPSQGSNDVLAAQRWARANLYPLTGKPWLADWLYVKELAGKSQAMDSRLVSHIHDIGRRADVSSSLDAYGSSFSFPSPRWNANNQSNTNMLSQLSLPVLIMWGGRSLLPISEADQLAAHLQNAEVKVVKYEDGGHWLPLYRPSTSGSDVLEFLSPITHPTDE